MERKKIINCAQQELFIKVLETLPLKDFVSPSGNIYFAQNIERPKSDTDFEIYFSECIVKGVTPFSLGFKYLEKNDFSDAEVFVPTELPSVTPISKHRAFCKYSVERLISGMRPQEIIFSIGWNAGEKGLKELRKVWLHEMKRYGYAIRKTDLSLVTTGTQKVDHFGRMYFDNDALKCLEFTIEECGRPSEKDPRVEKYITDILSWFRVLKAKYER